MAKQLLMLDQLTLQAEEAHAADDQAKLASLAAQLQHSLPRLDLATATRFCAALRDEHLAACEAITRTHPHDSLYHYAALVALYKSRTPDHHEYLPQILQHLERAASAEPPLLIAKLRYVHYLLQQKNTAAAEPLIAEILRHGLSARDVEVLALILHGGGASDSAIALLSQTLNQTTDPATRFALGLDLIELLNDTGKASMGAELQAMLLAEATADQRAAYQQLTAWRQPARATPSSGAAATILVTTNISPKLQHHGAIAPPSDALLRQTLNSLYTQLQAPRDWPLVIYFDEPADAALAAAAADYKTKLQVLCAEFKATLHCRPAWGLRKIFVEALGNITTPYYFLLEHDWTFSAAAPPLPTLHAVLEQQPQLNVLRYNYNYNLMTKHDALLLPLTVQQQLFTQTIYYCNNPSLVRTAKMQRDWLPLLTEAKYDSHNGGAGGVEETIAVATIRLAATCGLLPTLLAMGCAITGPSPHAPTALHWGI